MISTILIFLAGLLALMALTQVVCTSLDARRLPAPGELVSGASGPLHVHKAGSGDPAIILEAGISASSLSWSVLQPRLAGISTAYSYDRAGLGWSRSRRRRQSLQAIVADLDAWLTSLEVRAPFILMAHSFGAYIVRYYARAFPEKVAGIVLVDPLTPEEWSHPTRQQLRTLRGGVLYSRIGGILASVGIVRFCLWLLQRGNMTTPGRVLEIFGAAANATVRRILGEIAKFPPEAVPFIRAHWSAGRSFWTMASYLSSLPACTAEMEACSSLPPEIPVTVVSGAHQPPERLAEHAALARGSMRGKHIIAARSGHWIHLDEPELLVEAVQEMMSSMPAKV